MSSTIAHGPRPVRIGTLSVGDGPAVLIGGEPFPLTGERSPEPAAPDARWISLRARRDAAGADTALARARAQWAGPLLVEPSSAADLPAIAAHADGIVLGADWAGDLPLVRAAAGLGLPILAQRAPEASLEEWLAVAEHCAAEGNERVVLCESGSRTHQSHLTLDLALMRAARERSRGPVVAGLGDDPALAAAAIAAGADGLLLAPTADARVAAEAREAMTVIGAVTRREVPASVLAAREAIDRVDAVLATLLERRAALAGAVQRLKPVGGFAGRDMDRERRLVAAMATRAPRLGEARLATVMKAVIEAGLHLAEEELAWSTGAGVASPEGCDHA